MPPHASIAPAFLALSLVLLFRSLRPPPPPPFRPFPSSTSLPSIPIELLAEHLSVNDLDALSLVSRDMCMWARRALRAKTTFVDCDEREAFRAGNECERIRALKLTSRTKASNRAVFGLVLQASNSLRFLSLNDLGRKINDASFAGAAGFDELVELELVDLPVLGDEGMGRLRGGELLQFLKIDRCKEITERGIQSLLARAHFSKMHLKSFTRLTVQGTLFPLAASSAATLIELNISSSRLDVDFLPQCGLLFPNLQALHANYCQTLQSDDLINFCANLGGTSRLKNLSLNGCDEISNSSMTCLPTSLHHLNVSQTSMDDEGLLIALNRCGESLESLFVASTTITDTSLFSIARNCHGLIEFGCSGCFKITDAGIRGLGSSLKNLFAVGCHITVDGVMDLIGIAPRLRQIWCSSLCENDLERIKSKRPNAKVIRTGDIEPFLGLPVLVFVLFS